MNLIIIAFILLAIELLYFRVANKFNIIDKPNLRSSHTQITLRGGGILFPIAAWVYVAFFGFDYPCFMIGLTLIAGISFLDDVFTVSNRFRIVVHFVSMMLMFYDLHILAVDSWWVVLIALVVCTGIINAYNFMDGINGITGGYSLAVLLPLILVNHIQPFIAPELLYVLSISVLVFCFFNFRTKAKCFAGDVGAVSLAFCLLFALGMLILTTQNIWYIVFLVVYGVDSVLTIAHRLILRENIFEAHRKHAYQLMANELKVPHIVVSAIYMCLQLVISLGFIYSSIPSWIYTCVTIVILGGIYILFMRRNYHLHSEYLENKNASC